MKREKLVKKSLPCSFFDIQGVQSWLDEMALQGLFLARLSRHSDRAFFRRGEPRPLRYRLDPMGRDWDGEERVENYARMGWDFVDAVPRTFCIFSCGDPEAPELHSDPASLSYALQTLVKRQTRDTLLLFGGVAAVTGWLLFLNRTRFTMELFLREHPCYPLSFLLLAGLLMFILLHGALQIRRLNRLRRILDDGLPLNAGRRRWRPPYLAIYLPLLILIQLLTNFAVHYTTVQWLDLDLAALSRSWPGLVQLEDAALPSHYSYMTINHSPAVPIQEHFTDRGAGFGLPFLKVWHYQADSPAAARMLYRLARNGLQKDLRQNAARSDSSESITMLTPLVPDSCPGLDALETASFRYYGLEGWAFAARRGNDILLVRYAGSAPLDHGLALFLDALGEEESP